MKVLQFPLAYLAIFFMGCDDHSHPHHEEEHGHHAHQAPHGGELYELGEHGKGFNFELHLNDQSKLELYILDAHAENFVRIKQKRIKITTEDNSHPSLRLDAIADSATGETIGDTSHFQSSESVTNLLPINGKIEEIVIGSNSYKNQLITFSGNPREDPHEH